MAVRRTSNGRCQEYSHDPIGSITTSGTPKVTGIKRKRLTGLSAALFAETKETDINGNVTRSVTALDRDNATTTVTTTTTGISRAAVAKATAGLAVSVTDPAGLVTTTTYDALLRKSLVTDSRGNKTKLVYANGSSLPATTISPYIADNSPGNISVNFSYDGAGRQTATTRTEDGVLYSTYTAYNLFGSVSRVWGSQTEPVEYGYDVYNQKTTMRTFRGGSGWENATWPTTTGTGDQTTWAYDAASGALLTKTDAANRAVTYAYNARGQLTSRQWARGLTTTYAYDTATGDQTGITYSDSTPALHYTYDRRGSATQIQDFTGTRNITRCDCGKVSNEQLDGTFYGGRQLTYLLAQGTGVVLNQTIGYALTQGSTVEQTVQYTYDGATGRFTDLYTEAGFNAAKHTFHYGYLANSPLIESLSVDSGHPFTISRTFETDRDVLTSIEAKWSASPRTKYAYSTNRLGQRSSVTETGDAFDEYGAGASIFQKFDYNTRGYLTNGTSYSGTAVDSNKVLYDRQFQYDYDNIGNRNWSARNGNTTLRDTYTTNNLNQYVTRDNNTLSVSGTADATALVQVGGSSSLAPRQGRYWNDRLVVGNDNAPWRGAISVYSGKPGAGPGGANLIRTELRMAQIAARLQSFTYDADGNMTSDGIWDYTWDAENRLITMATTSGAELAGFPYQRLEFRYDYLSRRAQKSVYNKQNQLLTGRKFLYDGWSLIAEYSVSGTSMTLARTYTWGLDIARTLTDAGGVGALLQIADHASSKAFFPTYDGNGNITSIVNSSSGSFAAIYEYSPYGELINNRSLDASVTDQPFRFSTQFYDLETGLYAYIRRYYDPRGGRWVSRDPKEELGGLHLYAYVANNPLNKWDHLGMDSCGDDEEEDHSNDSYLNDSNDLEDYLDQQAEAFNQEVQQVWDELDRQQEALETFFNSIFSGGSGANGASNASATNADPGSGAAYRTLAGGAQGTLFLPAGPSTLGAGVTVSVTAGGAYTGNTVADRIMNFQFQFTFSVSPLVGAGVAAYGGASLSGGQTDNAPVPGFSADLTQHAEGGLGVGKVANGSVDWKPGTVSVSPPTSRVGSSSVVQRGGAAYAAIGGTISLTFATQSPLQFIQGLARMQQCGVPDMNKPPTQ